jgi:hypothetical protein
VPELETIEEAEGFAEIVELPLAKSYVPTICRLKCCSCCRKLRYRDSNKPKKACIKLCCPSFFVARASANRFKMSVELL